MDERKDHLWKVAQEAEERIDDLVTQLERIEEQLERRQDRAEAS